MVETRATAAIALDAAASAISSASRRAIVERLVDGSATVTELAALLGISAPATLKHLDRLAAAGIITRIKSGRVVTVSLVPGSLDPLAGWAMQTGLFWTNHLDRFAAHVAGTTDQENP